MEARARANTLVVRVLSRTTPVGPLLERDGYRLTLPLIAQMADDVVVERRRDAAGSAITMRFDLPEPGPVGHAVADAGALDRG